jgi:signal transduction histidine kinase
MSNAVPTRLESEGVVAALHTALAHDFRDNFDAVDWQAAPEATEQACRLPLFVGEVVFYAAQEAIRNAAKHARGGDPRRKLNLVVAVESAKGLVITIGDDGVGRTRSVDLGMSRGDGSGSGLLFHGAMLAVVGGTLNVSDRPGGGTQVVIDLPGS